MPQQQGLPPIPDAPVEEGSRWRHHRPSGKEVAAWFASQRIDDGMAHEDYVSGVTLIPQSEKVKYTLPSGAIHERFEQTFTPYVQVGTRIAYFRKLAEYRELISVIEPVEVPVVQNTQSAYFNGNMEKGYWWLVVPAESGPTRFLCYTARAALYEPATYGRLIRGEQATPVLEGRSTNQVSGRPDLHMLSKVQTSAIGRALGVAGILTLGTGVASAEDMAEYATPNVVSVPEPSLPPALDAPPADPADELKSLRERALTLQSTMQAEQPEAWTQFATWWKERAAAESWRTIEDVPLESLRGVIVKMERFSNATQVAS